MNEQRRRLLQRFPADATTGIRCVSLFGALHT
jgi:hypothetical protein